MGTFVSACSECGPCVPVGSPSSSPAHRGHRPGRGTQAGPVWSTQSPRPQQRARELSQASELAEGFPELPGQWPVKCKLSSTSGHLVTPGKTLPEGEPDKWEHRAWRPREGHPNYSEYLDLEAGTRPGLFSGTVSWHLCQPCGRSSVVQGTGPGSPEIALASHVSFLRPRAPGSPPQGLQRMWVQGPSPSALAGTGEGPLPWPQLTLRLAFPALATAGRDLM